MPFLSPAKLLVILVVALIVLGPEKLPKVARQIGALWSDFQRFRQRIESEVRGSFPDLPSTEVISHAVRSPLSLLDHLAGTPPHPPESPSVQRDSVEEGRVPSADPDFPPAPEGSTSEAGRMHNDSATAFGGPLVHRVRVTGATVPDDPSMN